MKLALGTVQFGLNYGVSNIIGQTPVSEVAYILALASQNDIQVLDTAPLYGSSETALGQVLSSQQSFKVVTKTPQFLHKSITEEDVQELIATFYQSLSRLNQTSLYGLLIHRADDLLSPNGHLLMEAMLHLKQQQLVEKIGVSVYDQEQIDQILQTYTIDLIQVPVSVLDQRLLTSGHLLHLKHLGVEVHARSVFLQGLLLMEPEQLPSYFEPVKHHLRAYHTFLQQHHVSLLEAALGFVYSCPEIDHVVCGVNHHNHLLELLNATKIKQFNSSLGNLGKEFAISDPAILNPSQWRL
jgi:aryl-alcohol dehydrogenase-like predicted oxidoreductase